MKLKLLEKARQHIFSLGLNDGASILAKQNMAYGLAKMQYVQNKLGFKPNASFIGSPDETITRNQARWDAGYSYGGKISWGNKKDPIIFVDTKPNACGMLVAKLNNKPDPQKIVKRLNELQDHTHKINNVECKWDFQKGNHFIDVFKVQSKADKYPEYIAVMHAGNQEMKGENNQGMGLYWDHSQTIKEIMETVQTPFGPSYILTDYAVKSYMKMHETAVNFANERRVLAFKDIFQLPKKNIMVNKCHQMLANQNEIVLGCQTVEKNNDLFPVAIRADYHSYLVKAKKNFTDQQIERLGWYNRAKRLGVLDKIRNANICPHGGGYKIPDVANVAKVQEIDSKRYYYLKMKNKGQLEITCDVSTIPILYRGGHEVIFKTIENGLAEVAADLDPLYAIKA